MAEPFLLVFYRKIGREKLLSFLVYIHWINMKKIKIGLIIDEFFGGAGTQYGGYGKLARDYICKYLNGIHGDTEIIVDVILGTRRKFLTKKYRVDGVMLYKLPKIDFFARRFLQKKNYDIYLSIELVNERVLLLEKNSNKKLLLWIQDPRPMYEWDEINTVKLYPEPSYYRQEIYDAVHEWAEKGQVHFISQADCLNQKAIDLYKLSDSTAIQYLPNPIDIDLSFNIETYPKKDQIIFLGRIDSVKRGWLFCEIAKKMPQYDFYVLGKYSQGVDKMVSILEEYQKLDNLHFVGHVDGLEKEQYLKDAKILINTSIHEALPVSFLEALSYGTLLVSNRNPDDLTSTFGIWVGDVLGDGFDSVPKYVEAVTELMKDDHRREQLSRKAIEYIKNIHSVERFKEDMIEKISDVMDIK